MLERVSGGGTGDSGSGAVRDLPLTMDSVNALQDELLRIFSTNERARAFLRYAGFPPGLIPEWHSGYDFWGTVFFELTNGAMEMPYRRLITVALRQYGSNEVLQSLLWTGQAPAPAGTAAAATAESRPAAPVQAPPAVQTSPAVHLVVRISSEEERAEMEAWLGAQQFAPQQEWVSATAVSFRLNTTDENAVAERMRGLDVGWTVVPPGEPDYLLRQIIVEGPDGRTFRFNDVPASTTVGTLGRELIDQYPEGLPGSENPMVIDRVNANGSGERVNPDNTVHQEGIREGTRIRVGFQRQAAAVNPLDRRDALFGVRNQIKEYVDARPGFKVWPNSPALPTEYEIEFTEPSFGPPAKLGEPPADIQVHELSIVLGPEFPITAPRVRWLTEIFHPNVFPTYECEALRQQPLRRGLVCLGTLAESYQPSLDFGDLCATLQDIAGYRNYSVFVLSDDPDDPETGPVLRGDYYDRDAAWWAISEEGQARIADIGGAPVLRVLSDRPARYGFEIELDR